MNLRGKLISLFRTKKGDIILTRTVLKAGVVNSNGRIYSQDCILDINRQIQEKIKDGKELFGQFNSVEWTHGITLREVSHRIVDSNVEGDILGVKLKVLPTPKGKILMDLLKIDKNCMVFRPRGIGDVSAAGKVQNYQLISIDAIPKQDDSFIGLL